MELISMDLGGLFFISILLILAGIAYLVLRFFNQWTAKSQYKTVLNVLIFIVSYALLLFIAITIFVTNVRFER